jgi:hypothetical protein
MDLWQGFSMAFGLKPSPLKNNLLSFAWFVYNLAKGDIQMAQ